MKLLKPIAILMLLIPIVGFSQYKKGKGNGIYRSGQTAVDKGWYFGLGLSYMASSTNYTATFSDAINPAIQNKYLADPKGKFGALAEIGMFKMTEKKLSIIAILDCHGNG